MKTRILVIAFIGISFGLNAQNTFPPNGNVGVGISSPQSKIHLYNNDTGTSSGTGLTVEQNGTGDALIQYLLTGEQRWVTGIDNSDGNKFIIGRGHSWLTGKDLVITDNGNFGLGNSNPSMKLELGNLKNYDGIKFGDFFKIRTSDLASNNFVIENIAPAGNLYIRSRLSNTNGDLILNDAGGNVGIGTTNPGTWKLAVNGNIRAKEIKVETGWSDFVFENDYKLPTLKDVEKHIKEKGHLKNIPSAKDVEKNGIFLGEMDSKLLQKIEELTLYTIQQQKEIDELKQQNKKLLEIQKRIEKLEKK